MFSIRSLTFPSSSKLSRLVPQPRLLTTAQPRRTFPQYTVYGSNCMLSLKVVLPTFRATKQKAIYVDSKGLGRVVLEWIPRDSNGRGDRDMTVRFGLSPEELGVIVDQLPHHSVEFVRRLGANEATIDASNKLIRIDPPLLNKANNGMFSFVFDYERDGVNGVGPQGSYDVQVPLGEFTVLHELMRSSIPVVTGWSALLDCGIQSAMEQAMNEGGNDYRDVPF